MREVRRKSAWGERDKMMEARSTTKKQTAFVCLLVCVLASNELLIV